MMKGRISLGPSWVLIGWLGILGHSPAGAAGLAGAWGLNEGSGAVARDASGNGNHGAMTGAAWTTAGKHGGALVFNGAGGGVRVPHQASLDFTGGLTVSAWIYPVVLSGYKDIIVKGAGGGSNYYLETLDNQVAFGFFANGWREHVTRTANLTVNTWQHLAAVFDQTAHAVKIYVNGVERLSESETSAPPVNTEDLTLGFGFSGEDFAGRLDDVRVYGRALSALEVRTDMNTGVDTPPPPPPPPPPPTSNQDWPMVAGAVQRTGYSPDGTITTANAAKLKLAWSVPVNGKVTAQPLYAASVVIGARTRNLVIAATSQSTVYALDAATGAVVWSRALPVVTGACGNSPDALGIRSTPVLDRAKNRIFVVPSDGKLYTLSLTTGANLASPLTIIDLPITNKVRGGLNLFGSNLYIASGSGGCDAPPWRGRIYRVNVAGAAPVLAGAFDVIPGIAGNNRGGGIWGLGGVSIDPATGNVYAATGSDKDVGRRPYGRRMISLSSLLAVKGSYEAPPFSGPIPCDGAPCDLDFGATPLVFQPVGCPTLVLAGNKNGDLYLHRAADLDASRPPLQSLNVNIAHDWLGTGGVGGIPAYWPAGRMVFVTDSGPGAKGINGGVIGFKVLAAPACTLQVAWSKPLALLGVPKSAPTVNAGGVLFLGEGSSGLTHAYNAATGQELWNSGSSIPDSVRGAPTVAGSRLFVGAWHGSGPVDSGYVHAFVVGP